AAAALLHRLIDDLPGQAEAAEQVAYLLLGQVRVGVRPHRADHLLFRVEQVEVLVEVPGLDQVAALDRPLGRLLVAEKDAQERGLAATVRAHDPQPLAALELEAQPAEEALIAVSLGQVLDLEDDVAGARDVAEVHPRGLDAGRGLDALDLVQHLLPRLRLLSELPVVDAADVLLLLLDE